MPTPQDDRTPKANQKYETSKPLKFKKEKARQTNEFTTQEASMFAVCTEPMMETWTNQILSLQNLQKRRECCLHYIALLESEQTVLVANLPRKRLKPEL